MIGLFFIYFKRLDLEVTIVIISDPKLQTAIHQKSDPIWA